MIGAPPPGRATLPRVQFRWSGACVGAPPDLTSLRVTGRSLQRVERAACLAMSRAPPP